MTAEYKTKNEDVGFLRLLVLPRARSFIFPDVDIVFLEYWNNSRISVSMFYKTILQHLLCYLLFSFFNVNSILMLWFNITFILFNLLVFL